MDVQQRRLNLVTPPAGYPAAVARLVWMVEDTRQRTLETLEEMDPAWIDWTPPVGESIGTVLYHLAAIEIDWTYEEILVQPFSPAADALLPYPVRDKTGRLWAVTGESAAVHLDRLVQARALLLEALRGLDEDELHRVRQLPYYDVTPEWVIHHLMQHEAEHRGQIGTILAWAKRQ
jgi:uncharacterized damage-inducible protein DinB